jgi:hypothetical protein
MPVVSRLAHPLGIHLCLYKNDASASAVLETCLQGSLVFLPGDEAGDDAPPTRTRADFHFASVLPVRSPLIGCAATELPVIVVCKRVLEAANGLRLYTWKALGRRFVPNCKSESLTPFTVS